MWKKYGTARQATDDNLMQLKRFAYRVLKSTNTPSQYVILIGFPLQQLLHERPSIFRYKYIACLVNLYSNCAVCEIMATKINRIYTCTDRLYRKPFPRELYISVTVYNKKLNILVLMNPNPSKFYA
jgi:hypothetical protein